MTVPTLPLPMTEPAAVGLSAEALVRARDVLRREIDEGRLPGAVALVARHGKVAWFESLGTRDPAQGDPMTHDAIFRVYSMTKPIVSLAIMMLAEEGRLQLSDPVERWLPAFASARVTVERDGRVAEEPVSRPATVQDLLRHTAGLTYEFLGNGPVQRRYAEARLGDRRRDNAAFCAELARIPLLVQPGSRWTYGRATDVLGRLLEVMDDRPLGESLRARILDPLGMRDTDFVVPERDHHRIAEPFATDPDTGEAVRLLDVRQRPAFESGGGGLVSTASDYLRFLQTMLDGGRWQDTRLVGRKTVELMTADHLGGIPSEPDDPLLPAGHGFGLGFAVRTHAGLAPVPGSVGQYFWGGIAGTTFWVDPTEGLIAMLLIQAPGRRDHFRQQFRYLVHAALED